MINAKESINDLRAKMKYSFEDLCNLVSVLRSDDGCPWDREQTNESIRNCIIDETYEFIEGLDTNNDELMCEELGDVLFQIVFHADIKNDTGAFNVSDIIDGICKKMILRHPHVFGNITVANSDEVLVNWESIKNNEKQRKTPYEQLDSVSKALPALMRAQKLRSKAEKNGLISSNDFESSITAVENALTALKTNRNKEAFGHLLFETACLAKSLDAEAEEILYIENDNFVKGFKP